VGNLGHGVSPFALVVSQYSTRSLRKSIVANQPELRLTCNNVKYASDFLYIKWMRMSTIEISYIYHAGFNE
jgi:hypothetical protein